MLLETKGFEKMDKFVVYRPMLDLLGQSEGTDKGRGYNETLGYGAYTGGNKNLVEMTFAQIDRLQTQMLANPENEMNSSALGRYQIVRTTLREIVDKKNISGNRLFNERMQDEAACFLLGKRGIDKWLKDELPLDNLLVALAQEWASLPTPAGRGYYDNQRAAVSVQKVIDTLMAVRVRWLRREVPEPDVYDRSVGFWAWLRSWFA